MYRLAELSDQRRRAIGSILLVVGILGLAVGVFWIHWASYPQTEVIDGVEVPVVVDYFNWFPRGLWWRAIGYLIALGATTFSLVGAAMLWVLNQPMTWARAAVAATLSWIALVFFFGIVPSEWLNFAQTDLEWSTQRVAFAMPPFLVLGNNLEINYGAIKDLINVGYHTVMLGGAAVLALQLQKIKEGRPATARATERKSPYGRPLVRGER